MSFLELLIRTKIDSMKRISIIFYVLSLLFFSGGYSNPVSASTSLNAYLFYGEGCPHCAKEKAYLETIKDEYHNLKINSFEIYYNQKNISLFQRTAETLNVQTGGVPFLVIGDRPFIGYSANISPAQIEGRISECLITKCPDSVAKIVGMDIEEDSIEEVRIDDSKTTNNIAEINEPRIAVDKEKDIGRPNILEKAISIPFFGEVSIKNLSLPLLTIIIAFLDGLNPCAMWVLLFLVSLLFRIENRKRLWIFGLVFLLSSAVVYFLFMTAWLNLFMFLGFIVLIRIIIGIIALVSAYFNLKEYITNPTGGCKVVGGGEKRQRIFERLKQIIQYKSLVIAITGLILLAFAVNLVELVCSLGLPAIYTQVLSLSYLSTWEYYLYLVFYALIFIFPAFIIFAISATTLQLTGISTKYGRLVHLISGIIMLVLGILMIFKPEWLMFG